MYRDVCKGFQCNYYCMDSIIVNTTGTEISPSPSPTQAG